MPAGDGAGQPVQCHAWDAPREEVVAHTIEQLAMGCAFGAAIRGIFDVLQGENRLDGGERSGCGDGVCARLFTGVGNLEGVVT